MVTASLEASIGPLQRMPYIQYLVQFQNNKVQALIDSSSEVNVMILAYAMKLSRPYHSKNQCRSPEDRWLATKDLWYSLS